MASQKESQGRQDVHARSLRAHTQTDGLIVEPLQELPPLDGGQRQELLESIRERGILSPLILSGKYIIDGRERHAIALDLGLATIPVKDLGTLDGPGQRREYAIRINAERRHLSPEQRRALLEAFIKAAPSKSSREVADALKVDRSTVDRARRRMVEGGAIAPPAKVEGRDGKDYKNKPLRKPPAPKQVEPEKATRVPEPEPVEVEPVTVQPIKGDVCSYSEVCQLIDETPDDGRPKSVYRIQALAEVIGLTYEEAMEQSMGRRRKMPSPSKVGEPAVVDKGAIYITPPKGNPRLFSGAWWRENATGHLVYIHDGDCNMVHSEKGYVRDKSVSYVACYATKLKELEVSRRRFDPTRHGKSRHSSHEEFYRQHTFDPKTTLKAKIRDAAEHLGKIDLSKLRGQKRLDPFWARVAVKQVEQLLELGE